MDAHMNSCTQSKVDVNVTETIDFENRVTTEVKDYVENQSKNQGVPLLNKDSIPITQSTSVG